MSVVVIDAVPSSLLKLTIERSCFIHILFLFFVSLFICLHILWFEHISFGDLNTYQMPLRRGLVFIVYIKDKFLCCCGLLSFNFRLYYLDESLQL